MIAALYRAYNSYRNNETYELFPRGDNDGYNSNSFIHGLLDAAGFTNIPDPAVNTPGWSKPVPLEDFPGRR
jgi:ABC-type Fe3+-hydroxamate transport system substrate-binding protein